MGLSTFTENLAPDIAGVGLTGKFRNTDETVARNFMFWSGHDVTPYPEWGKFKFEQEVVTGNGLLKLELKSPMGGVHTIARPEDKVDFVGYGVDLRFYLAHILSAGDAVIAEMSAGDVYGINITEQYAANMYNAFLRLAKGVKIENGAKLSQSIPQKLVFHNRQNRYQMIELSS